MTRELARVLEAPTPEVAKSLSPQDLVFHREKIRFSIQTVLSVYFQPHEDDAVRTAQLAWWCDELEDWTVEQVQWALRKWNRENPRIRPTPGDIVKICKDERGRRIAASRPAIRAEPEREKISAERASEIMAEVGFEPKRMGGGA